MIEADKVNEILYAVALGLAEETKSEPFPYNINSVYLGVKTATCIAPLCLLSLDEDTGSFTLRLANSHSVGMWSEPLTVDLMEPDSITKALAPLIPMSNVFKTKQVDDKPPNPWAHRSIFSPKRW